MIGSGMMTAAKIDAYSRDIDRTLLHENLKLTPAQRLEKFVSFSRFIRNCDARVKKRDAAPARTSIRGERAVREALASPGK